MIVRAYIRAAAITGSLSLGSGILPAHEMAGDDPAAGIRPAILDPGDRHELPAATDFSILR